MEAKQNPAAAIGFMLTASALVAGTTLIAKLIGRGYLGEPLHPLQISHGRFLFAFLAFSGYSLAARLRITQPNLKLHAARSFAGWSGISLTFAAVAFIPLADATAISFLNPFFAMLLAIPFLGEKVGPWRWIALAIALSGALVLARPGAGSFELGALIALAAAFALGVEVIFIKLLTNREAPLQILWINNAIGLTIASLAVLFVFQWPSPAQWLALAVLGFTMALAQTCFIQSMRRAEASLVAPFIYTTLLFAAAYDFLWFATTPTRASLTGSALILSAAGLLAWRESRKAG
ncbi:MAG: hypothetical protein CR993_06620 [Rhodobacterales bacterium]|nr:MAG: hypothetical protein CR993_06620 [Rhodobacterales bacterium]